jgi:hypothetical protein
MEYLVIILILGSIIFKFREKWLFSLFLNICMYSFYLWLWYVLLNHHKNIYRGDSGLGFAFITFITMPFYIIVNISFLIYSFKIKLLNKTFVINLIGLIFCIIHLITFYFLTNGFS